MTDDDAIKALSDCHFFFSDAGNEEEFHEGVRNFLASLKEYPWERPIMRKNLLLLLEQPESWFEGERQREITAYGSIGYHFHGFPNWLRAMLIILDSVEVDEPVPNLWPGMRPSRWSSST